jgi:small subunit ribosomal protein S8
MSTLTDPIADFLTRLRNAASSHRADVKLPYSKIKEEIARILKEEGYIAEYEVDHSSRTAVINVTLYFVNLTAALTVIKRVSKPGLRMFVGAYEVPRVLGVMGTSILSS